LPEPRVLRLEFSARSTSAHRDDVIARFLPRRSVFDAGSSRKHQGVTR